MPPYHAQLSPWLLGIQVLRLMTLDVHWLSYLRSSWWGLLLHSPQDRDVFSLSLFIRQHFPNICNFLSINSRCSTGTVLGLSLRHLSRCCLHLYLFCCVIKFMRECYKHLGPQQKSWWHQRMWSGGLHLTLTRLLEMEAEAEPWGSREDAVHSRIPVSFRGITVCYLGGWWRQPSVLLQGFWLLFSNLSCDFKPVEMKTLYHSK